MDLNNEIRTKDIYEESADLIMKDFTESVQKDDFVTSVNNDFSKIKNKNIPDQGLEIVVEKCKPEISCKKIKLSSGERSKKFFDQRDLPSTSKMLLPDENDSSDSEFQPRRSPLDDSSTSGSFYLSDEDIPGCRGHYSGRRSARSCRMSDDSDLNYCYNYEEGCRKSEYFVNHQLSSDFEDFWVFDRSRKTSLAPALRRIKEIDNSLREEADEMKPLEVKSPNHIDQPSPLIISEPITLLKKSKSLDCASYSIKKVKLAHSATCQLRTQLAQFKHAP